MQPKTKVTLFLSAEEFALLRLFAMKRLKTAERRRDKADLQYDDASGLSAELNMMEKRQ